MLGKFLSNECESTQFKINFKIFDELNKKHRLQEAVFFCFRKSQFILRRLSEKVRFPYQVSIFRYYLKAGIPVISLPKIKR
jgi:hypothetical protein